MPGYGPAQRGSASSAFKSNNASSSCEDRKRAFGPQSFVGEHDIHVDPNQPKIKLSLSQEDINDQERAVKKEVEDVPTTVIHDDNMDIFIYDSSSSSPLKPKREGGSVPAVDAHQKTADDDITSLREEVESLKKTVEDQSILISKLNKMVEKHDDIINMKLEAGEKKFEESIFENFKEEYIDKKSSRSSTSGVQSQSEAFRDDESDFNEDSSVSSKDDYSAMNANKNNQNERFESKKVTWHQGKAHIQKAPSPWMQFFQQKSDGRQFDKNENGQEMNNYQFNNRNRFSRGGRIKRGVHHSAYVDVTMRNRKQFDGQFKARGSGRARPLNNRGKYFNLRYGRGRNKRQSNFTRNQFEYYRFGETSNLTDNDEEENENGKCAKDDLFECDYCPWKFREQEQLEAHLKTHKLFTCSICKQEFSFKESLRQHLKQRHDIDGEDAGKYLM